MEFLQHDIIIINKGKEYKLHKQMLNKLPYFNMMFESKMVESFSNKIKTEFNEDYWNKIIDVIYENKYKFSCKNNRYILFLELLEFNKPKNIKLISTIYTLIKSKYDVSFKQKRDYLEFINFMGFSEEFILFYKEMIAELKVSGPFSEYYYQLQKSIWSYLFDNFIYLCDMKIFYIFYIKSVPTSNIFEKCGETLEKYNTRCKKLKKYARFLLKNGHSYEDLKGYQYYDNTYYDMLSELKLVDEKYDDANNKIPEKKWKRRVNKTDFTGKEYFVSNKSIETTEDYKAGL